MALNRTRSGMCRCASARGRVDAGLRADNYAVSAANPKAAQCLRDDHCGMKRASSLSRILLHAKQSMLAERKFNEVYTTTVIHTRAHRLHDFSLCTGCSLQLRSQCELWCLQNLPWADLPGPGGAVPDQLIDQSIKRAVDEQLAQKGLTRVEKDADLHVGYHAIVREEKGINLSAFGDSGPWGWGGGWGGVNSSTVTGQTSTIPVGTLLVDLYDPAKNNWSGAETAPKP